MYISMYDEGKVKDVKGIWLCGLTERYTDFIRSIETMPDDWH